MDQDPDGETGNRISDVPAALGSFSSVLLTGSTDIQQDFNKTAFLSSALTGGDFR